MKRSGILSKGSTILEIFIQGELQGREGYLACPESVRTRQEGAPNILRA